MERYAEVCRLHDEPQHNIYQYIYKYMYIYLNIYIYIYMQVLEKYADYMTSPSALPIDNMPSELGFKF